MSFDSFSSYPSIYNLGHRAVADLLKTPVLVQEKVDGSQFSFGVDPTTGDLRFRSKGAEINASDPEKMFKAGVEHITDIKDRLIPGWTYRGEYLQRPKHNALAYDRVPSRNVILFDISTGNQEFLPYPVVASYAMSLGLEVVPLLFEGIPTIEDIHGFLAKESILGGQLIEGVVLKPVDYNLFGPDKKVLMGKHVSEAFREVHKGEWKASNPTQGDVIAMLGAKYTSQARWQKAVMHLKEAGLLTQSPKDIGPLMAEVPKDVLKECEDEIKEQLWSYTWPKIKRMVTHGLPEWYKEELLKSQFGGDLVHISEISEYKDVQDVLRG